jgi:predicted GIY-YIG superfamily endonuclease
MGGASTRAQKIEREARMNGDIFIYGLVHPKSRRIFYVGATEIPLKRLLAHRTQAIPPFTNSPREQMLASLGSRRSEIELVILEVCQDEKAAGEAEAHWIFHGLARDWPLTNSKVAPKKHYRRAKILDGHSNANVNGER